MMKVFPIKSPVAGEQVVGVNPEIKTFTDKDWRKRLNNFTGRALTHTALRTEQRVRSGRIATLGQMVSPGVIFGLEADKASYRAGDGTQQAMIQISPGSGIAASGEVVTITRPLQVEIRDIRVYAPVTLLGTVETTGSTIDSESTEVTPGDFSGLLARRLGPTLREVIRAEREIPPAAILVLQPIQAEIQIDRQDDPCELDPVNYAYENWQMVDGARLVLYSWPEEVLTMPIPNATWRNSLANKIFTLEQHLSADELLPWMGVGVPIALIGFDETWEPAFVDRNSVVRSGGKRRRTASVLPDVGNRFFWQARFEQFNEHLADLVSREEMDESVTQFANAFRYLPPIGVLPKKLIDPKQLKHSFFPLNYHVEAAVIPYEQLDVVVQDSAALAPFDFNSADRIQTLVPVPQIYYEPDLLNVEVIDPEFDATIQRFTESRNDWLGRRLEIRRKASAVNKAIKGEALEFEIPDPDAVDNAELAAPFENAIIEFGADWRYLKVGQRIPDAFPSSDFDDSGWSTGPTGVDFGEASDAVRLGPNHGGIFFRKKFILTEVDSAKNYKLVIETNGACHVFLQGKKVVEILPGKEQAPGKEFDLGSLGDLAIDGNTLAVMVLYDVTNTNMSFDLRFIEKQYIEDIEADDYSTTIQLDNDKTPVLDKFEPVYEVAAFEELKSFVDGKSFLAPKEKSELENLGIEKYIDFLQVKVNEANDKVDFGFLRLHTDIYRVRQFVLGNVEASRLATSPVLASIAKGDTAVATRAEIENLAMLLKAESGTSVGTADTRGGRSSTVHPGVLRQSIRSSDLSISGDRGVKATATRGKSIGGGPRTISFDPGVLKKIDLSPAATKAKLAKDTISGGVFLRPKTRPVEIEEQSFIVGNYQRFNNVTVGGTPETTCS